MSLTDLTDTIVAQLTPPGLAAVSVVRLSGGDSFSILEKLTGCCQATIKKRQRMLLGLKDSSGRLYDRALVYLYESPHSYTGEDVIEICCHGNPLIVAQLLEDCVQFGARHAIPGEFTHRAHLNDKLNLDDSQAILDMIYARDMRMVRAAARHLGGRLAIQLGELSNELKRIAANLWGPIEFPMDLVDGSDSFQQDIAVGKMGIKKIVEKLDGMLPNLKTVDFLRRGIKTVIVGSPNAGKSTLLNRLLGSERALVSPEPGTTRDYLAEQVTFAGLPICLVDTAGLRESDRSSLESAGMQRTREQLAAADIVWFVYDVTDGDAELKESLLAEIHRLADPDRIVLLANKIDLYNHEAYVPKMGEIVISALTGYGIDDLESYMRRFVGAEDLPEDSVYALNSQQFLSLQVVKNALLQALDAPEVEQMIHHLEQAIQQLNGWPHPSDSKRSELSNEIFSQFCIGK